MKLKPDHVETIRAAILEEIEKQGGAAAVVAKYETGNFERADKVKDLQTRFCFDLFYSAGLTAFICETVYLYASDSHILTALKSICPKVTKRY
jgi:hypothetical protein